MQGLILLGLCLVVVFVKSEFTITDCTKSDNKVLQLSNITLAPEPVLIPGVETLSLDVQVLQPISGSHYTLDMVMKMGIFKIPCEDGVGSCSYDVCEFLAQADCPPELADATPDGKCSCPFAVGSYHIDGTTFDVPEVTGLARLFAEGDFTISLQVTDTELGEEVACYDLMVTTQLAD